MPNRLKMFLLNKSVKTTHQLKIVAECLLKLLKIKFTSGYLHKKLEEHNDYPSLISIMDVFKSCYSIESVALKMNFDQLSSDRNVTFPLIAQLRMPDKEYVFAVVTNISEKFVELFNPSSNKDENLLYEEFEKIYSGIILLVEGDEFSKEKDFEINKKKESKQNFRLFIRWWGLPILTIVLCFGTLLFNFTLLSVLQIIYSLVTMLAALISVLIIWHEVDEYNPLSREICRAGKKINCSAVLSSKASKIFGISWGCIGFAYFFGSLLILFLVGLTNTFVLEALSWFNLCTLPYIIFSLFYQWKIAKQWCPLCLTIQTLLLFQFIVSVWGGFHFAQPIFHIPFQVWFRVILSMLLVFIITQILVPTLLKAKEDKSKLKELQNLKRNRQIFEALLEKQKSISAPAINLGITIGNSNGSVKLIKICNPFCGPCAKAHPIIDELCSYNPELSVQIIFTATENDNDRRKLPVAHLLAISSEKDKDKIHSALNDWYTMPKKNYDVFASKYPVKRKIELQNEKIKEMREWCKDSQIAFTPTFFIAIPSSKIENSFTYYQLPSIYKVEDLKHFLSS